MTTARPRDFRGHGVYNAVVDPGSDTEVLCYDDEGTVLKRIGADVVLVGGGLPDEAVEMCTEVRDHRALFEDADVCTKTEGGTRYVWIAP